MSASPHESTSGEIGAEQNVAGEIAPARVVAERMISSNERILFGVAAVALLFDQLLKWWIRGALETGDEMPLIPGLVHLSHIKNHGAAWGMFAGQRWLLIGVSVVVVGALLFSARQIARGGALVACAMGLIFGGAVGNLIDRCVSGAVTDMIDMDTPLSLIRTFPVFNIADSALTIGVILLIWHSFFGPGEKKSTLDLRSSD